MKSKKILVGILSTGAIGIMAPAIASCNPKKPSTTPSVELSTSTPKTVVVGKATSQVDYDFIQKNVTKPNETKLEIINLKADEGSVEPIDGLLSYQFDTNNNILGNFNLSLAKTQYSASKFNFDIKITNENAKLNKTISGFEIAISTLTFNITYPADAQGLVWDIKPSDVGYHDNLEIKFHLNKGYEFVQDETELDILIGGTSVKTIGGVIFDLTSKPYSPNGCVIYVPAEHVDDEVVIKLKTKAKTFHVSKGIGSHFYCAAITEITHNTGKIDVEFHPDSYYETLSWDVTMSGQSIKGAGASLITKENKQYLQIDSSLVVDDLYISASAKAKSYDIKLNPSTEHITFTADKGTCENNFEGQLTIEPGYEVKTFTGTCTDDSTGDKETFPITVNDEGWFTIESSKIHGPIVLNGTTQAKTFSVTYSITATDHIKYDTTKTEVTYPNDFTTTIEPENGYYTFSPATDTWDVQVNGTSLKQSGKATFGVDKKTLTVDGASILNNLTITAKSSPATWQINPTYSTHLTQLSTTSLTYNTDFVADLVIGDNTHYTFAATAVCHDANGKGDIDISDKIVLNASAKKLTIPAKYVTGAIDITFTETANKYKVSIVDGEGGSHFTYDSTKIGDDKATYGSQYSIEIAPTTLYTLSIDNITVKNSQGTAYTNTSYNATSHILTVNGIDDNATITVKPQPTKFKAEAGSKDTGLTLSLDESQGSEAQYTKDYVYKYTLDEGYELKKDSIQCTVAGTEDPLTEGEGLTIDETHNTITVDGDKITGDIKLTGKGQIITYQLTNEAIGISSVSGTPTYKEALDINVAMVSGYLLTKEDFTNSNLKVFIGDDRLTASYFSVEDNVIKIPAGYITDNVKITGEVKTYNVSAKAKTGSEAAFVSIPTATATKSTTLTYHATLAEGYANPTVVAKCGTTELTPTINVDGTDVSIRINASDVLGPLSLELDAEASTISFNEGAETQLAVGDTSEAYSATVNPGGQDITIEKTSGPSDIEWRPYSGVLLAKDTPGTVTLTASYQGCVPVTHNVEIVKPTISITGSSTIVADTQTRLSWDWSGVTPKSYVRSKTWDSSDKSVATIDGWGDVTALKAGTTKITMSVLYGNLTEPIVGEFDLTVKTNKTITFDTSGLSSKSISIDGLSEGVKLASPSVTFEASLIDTVTPKTGYFTFTNEAQGISFNSGYVGIEHSGSEITVDFSSVFEQLTVDSAELTVTWTEIKGAQVLVGGGWDTNLFSSPTSDTGFVFDVDGYKTIKNITTTAAWTTGYAQTVFIKASIYVSSTTAGIVSQKSVSTVGGKTITFDFNIDTSKLADTDKIIYLACSVTNN